MEAMLGQIELFPYGFAPRGWMLCNGAAIQILANNALFALLGTRFGGDGVKYFNLPNLLGTEPIVNMNYYIAMEGYFPSRS